MFTAFNDYFKTAEDPESLTKAPGSAPSVMIRIRLDEDLTIIEHQALLGSCEGRTRGVIEAHGPAYNDLVHPEDRQRVKAELNKAVRYHAQADLKHRLAIGLTVRYVWMQGGVVRRREPVVFDMLVRDITRQVTNGSGQQTGSARS